jgi:hypothetical protein
LCDEPLFDLGHLRDDNSHEPTLEGVSIDKDLSSERRCNVHVLQLLGSDVLTLRELEDVLCSVDDLNRTIWVDHTNITRG